MAGVSGEPPKAQAAPGESQKPVPRTWMPTTAGILSIIAGGIDVTVGGVVLVLGEILGAAFTRIYGIGVIIGAPLIAVGVVAIIGGIYAIKRKMWGLALAGAICSLFLAHVGFLGIAAIIFVALSKKEFTS